MTRRPLRIAVFGIALALAACGGSPAGPSGGVSVAGNWTGTWQFVTAGVTVTDTVTATLTQDASGAAGGNWSAAGGGSGRFTFTAGPSISGSFTIQQTLLTGGICQAMSTLTGTASSSALDFTVPPISGTGLCQWASDLRFSLRRQ
jgi:hypothetical protein